MARDNFPTGVNKQSLKAWCLEPACGEAMQRGRAAACGLGWPSRRAPRESPHHQNQPIATKGFVGESDRHQKPLTTPCVQRTVNPQDLTTFCVDQIFKKSIKMMLIIIYNKLCDTLNMEKSFFTKSVTMVHTGVTPKPGADLVDCARQQKAKDKQSTRWAEGHGTK